MKGRKRVGIATIRVAAVMIVAGLLPDPASANPQIMVKAKDKGHPAATCQYCHVSKVPTKETFKPDDLNERGKWLVAEKDKQKVKSVDVDWLEKYPGGKN